MAVGRAVENERGDVADEGRTGSRNDRERRDDGQMSMASNEKGEWSVGRK